MLLDPIQIRVLGALIEKEIITPENYPLSLNSLIAACNQRSSRDPVLDLTEDEVRQAVHSLEDMEIVAPVRDARVPKYEHRIRTVLNLRRDETAILCLLLLRGPQTPGELRSRSDRMFSFDDLAAVQSTLERMASRTAESDSAGTGPLVVMLARQPGARESRYAHLIGGPIAAAETARSLSAPAQPQGGWTGALIGEAAAQSEARLAARLEVLEEDIRQLRSRVDALESAKAEPALALEPPGLRG
jgi:uncharacterized protein YceH (UPF0502 family)